MSIVLLLTCRHLRVQNANGILTVPTALWQCQRHFANADGFDLHYTNRGLTSHKGSADRLTQPRQGSKEAKRYNSVLACKIERANVGARKVQIVLRGAR